MAINVDDEPVPPFVHNLSPFLLGKPILSHEHWIYRMKAVPRRHPQVTMRLETPVITSTHLRSSPPAAESGGPVSRRWLTYISVGGSGRAGVARAKFRIRRAFRADRRLPAMVRSRGRAMGSGPSTDWKVWTAPRNVTAATVRSAEGEYEKYLFYRGVGHCRRHCAWHSIGPPRNLRSAAIRHRPVRWKQPQRSPGRGWSTSATTSAAPFRTVPEFELRADNRALLATTTYGFAEEEYAPQRLDALRREMHAELTRAGLFDDEATAMLNTWERAYFTQSGLRLFYVVPRSWTDAVLPLRLSIDAEIARVMLGRIELISDRQQELLARLAETPPSNDAWIQKIVQEQANNSCSPVAATLVTSASMCPRITGYTLVWAASAMRC